MKKCGDKRMAPSRSECDTPALVKRWEASSGSGGAMAQSVAKAETVNCDAKAQRGKATCSRLARATAPIGDEASYQSSNRRQVGSIVIPAVAAAAAVGLAIALVASGNGRGPVVVVSP